MTGDNGKNTVLISTALACEAKPFIDRYKLKPQDQFAAFPCYSNGEIALVVSGLGRVAMAAASAYLSACFAPYSNSSIWLNVGIAGHRDAEPGTAFMVDKVTEQCSGKTWYPVFSVANTNASTQLVTVDEPVSEYGPNCLYDMEGSAFCETASRFSIFEFIHLYKVVSDNKTTGLEHINKHYVTQLIESKVEEIDAMLNSLTALIDRTTDEAQEEGAYRNFIQSASFSFTQQQQLRRLLQRFYSLSPDKLLDVESFDNDNPKQILQRLEGMVTSLSADGGLR